MYVTMCLLGSPTISSSPAKLKLSLPRMLGLNRQTAAKPCIIVIPDSGEDLSPVLAANQELGMSLKGL